MGFSEYNTNYLKIVDIAEEQDFTIEVGMGQTESFLEHHRPGLDSVTELYSSLRYTSNDVGNGVLAVLVVNELTTPNSIANNDIEVNVFVSMGDDFEVAVPAQDFGNWVLAPQSGELVPESQGTEEPSAPQQMMSTVVGMPPAEDSNLNKVFFGEAITTFRTMLKRYALWTAFGRVSPLPTVVSGRFSNFPYYRGAVPDAVDLSLGATPYNYCNTVLLHWVRSAYSGSRGAIRYKLVPRGCSSRSDRIDVQRSTYKENELSYYYDAQALQPNSDLYRMKRNIIQQLSGAQFTVNTPGRKLIGYNGITLTNNQVNGVLEFEVPYYSPYRFTPGKTANLTGPMTFEGAWDYYAEFGCESTAGSEAGVNSGYDVYVAAGEDFQTYFFTGLPRMYFEFSPLI